MKKKIINLLLAFVLVAVLLPIMSVPASATEYSSGAVPILDLKKGDVIHAGVTVKMNGDIGFRVYRTPSPNQAISAYLVADNCKNWTPDKNYYIVYDGSVNHLLVYPTSDITFYPNGGTANGTTAPLTFLAVEETGRYCDVSWLTPKRPGCTFLGWYTSDGKEQVYNANGIAVNSTYWKNGIWQGQGAKSFIAKWKANTSVTFRYFPNGGTGQPDNFVQWTADATYFDTHSSDSHWNYTSGTYKLTRVGYTATGNYAKKDGSCVVHEDQTFTSYPQLCAAYGLNPDTCGNATVDIYAQWTPNAYTVNFNANGGSGTMASQSFTWDTAQNLTANAFTYNPTLSFDENGGNAVSDASVEATFGGWEDRSTTTYGDTTYNYTDFDAPGYAIRNNDVFISGYCDSVYNKNGLLDHYINHGKNEYANGSTSRAPNTGYLYGYPNGAKVSNLTLTSGGTVNLYAKWKYGNTTLPTPTKTGHVFAGWKGDLMDIATFTNGMEIGDITRGTLGFKENYAITENLIPVVGGATYTSNFEVCGLYSFDANGNFIRRESSYATTHTVSSNAAFVRIEVNTAKGVTFDQYQNELTLTYTLPAGTSFPVGGNQTLTAQWEPATYTITFDAQGGTTSLKSLPVVYGSNQNNKIDAATNPTKTDYTFLGWFTEPQGGEQVYQVSNGSCLACTYWSGGYDDIGRNAVWQYAGNVTLYAHWTYSGVSTITFDAQGGTTTLKKLTATYGSSTNNCLDTATNPTKEGYTFDGWFDAPTGGAQVYKLSNGSCIQGAYWTKAWDIAGPGAKWKGPKELTLYAHWIPKKYTVTWKNHDGAVLEIDKNQTYGTIPEYNGATPTRPDDENFTYIFSAWSPAVSAVTGDTEYTAQFTATSKRVEPTYTITIPAAVNEGESFTVRATGVVLNTDQTLTVTLQSDFKLKNRQNVELDFKINGGAVTNNSTVLSVMGNGDKNNPLAKNSDPLTVKADGKAIYAGTYTGSITFVVAVNTAENN